MLHNMFHLSLPILEKILRPLIVYTALIAFLRLFGKRELAQLNPFDLVVLLSLANTAQNAMIGDDNSVSGGLIGAFSLLTANWILSKLIFKMPKLNDALQGSPTTLIRDGKIDEEALRSQTLTHQELLSVIHKQGLTSVQEVRQCVLEPAGTFYIEPKTPSFDEAEISELLASVRALTADVRHLRTLVERSAIA